MSTDIEITAQDRRDLAALRGLLGKQGAEYREYPTQSVYGDTRIERVNCTIAFTGGGGPEPEWIYEVPRDMAGMVRTSRMSLCGAAP